MCADKYFSMFSNQTKIPAVECPWYVKDWINKWSGMECYDTTLEQVSETNPKTFVVNEDFIIDNLEKVFRVMEQNNIKELVIHALHIYKFNRDILDKLDKLSEGKKVHFISMSYMVDTFKNVKAHSHDNVEHGISHDFNYLLAESLQSKRRPHLDFIFMVNKKNAFRRRINDALEQAGILKNSIVRNGGPEHFKQLYKLQNDLFNSIESKNPNHQFLDALRSWSILPDLKAYEQSFCEIVIESTNTQDDNTYDSNFSDLSEKTYRPIALGIPFVFLGSKKMLDKLNKDGYLVVDDDIFYSKWHSSTDIDSKISHLINFLNKIISDKEIKRKLADMAKHNFKNFWLFRKLEHRKNNYKICKDCFGEGPIDKIYDLMNS